MSNMELFAIKLSAIFKMCGQEIDPTVISMYWNGIKKFNLDQGQSIKALDEIFFTCKPGGKPPCFQDLIAVIDPSKSISEVDEARILTKKIIASLSRHDYMWPMNGGYDPHPTFKDSFIAELGEFAWFALEQYGGYMVLFGEWSQNDSNFESRLRDFLISLRKCERIGNINPRIGMTEKKQIDSKKQLEKISFQIN